LWQLDRKDKEATRIIPTTDFVFVHVTVRPDHNGGQVIQVKGKPLQILVRDFKGNVLKEFDLRRSGEICDISPCGGYLLVSDGFGRSFHQHRIYVLDLRSGDESELTEGSFASWSPDGSRIAIAHGDGALYVFDCNARMRERIAVVGTELPEGLNATYGRKPLWSPDGKWILFILAAWQKSERSENHKFFPKKACGLDPFRDWCPATNPSAFVVNVEDRRVVFLNRCADHWTWRPVKKAAL
jgi:WD40 repeat protein